MKTNLLNAISKIRYLVLMLVLTMVSTQVWGAKDDVVYKINTASTKIGNTTTYKNYGPTACASAETSTVLTADWVVTLGSAQTAGLWLGSNSGNKAKMILSNGSFTEADGIASAIGVTTSATYYAAMICRTNFSNVYKVNLTYTTPGGTAPSEAWILYSTDNGSTWTVGKKVTSLSTSGTDFEFSTVTSAARYAFVIHSTNYCQFKVPVLTFYEGGSDCAKSVTINKGTATNCSFTLSKSGAQASCDGVATTVTITPNTGYATSSVTQSGASTAPTISGSGDTRTVTYAANTTGTSTINVTCTAQSYTVTLNKNSGTGGTSSVSATYNATCPTIASAPTREGYTFGGYYTGSGGTGTKVVNADLTWVASVSGYTDASKKWIKAAATTLYANWVPNVYTVTWKVNGVAYSTGSPSTSVNHGEKVATLPTAPSPASYCGDKFMGWTTVENYDAGTAPSPLFTTASGAPTATGNQVFHAVFGYYEE